MDNQKIGKLLLHVWDRLLLKYGRQHWWPAEERFEVIAGAILTQSAAWTNVEKALNNLKAAGKLSPEGLRSLTEAELAALIYPSGYYNVKAKKLKAFAGWLGGKYNDSLDKLFKNNIESLRKQLLDIYGIGEETADSIILYAGNKPVFVIDAYTRRIIDRIGLTPPDRSYAVYQKLFMANLPPDVKLYNEYHALLVRHGKEVCRQRPRCEQCCLNTRAKTGGGFPCSILPAVNPMM